MLHGDSPGTAWCPTVGLAVSGAGKVTVTTDRYVNMGQGHSHY